MSFYECKSCGGAVGLFCSCGKTEKSADRIAELEQKLSVKSAKLEKVVELFTDYERLMDERNDQSGMLKYAELHDYVDELAKATGEKE